jgi:hypothetical protein
MNQKRDQVSAAVEVRFSNQQNPTADFQNPSAFSAADS